MKEERLGEKEERRTKNERSELKVTERRGKEGENGWREKKKGKKTLKKRGRGG